MKAFVLSDIHTDMWYCYAVKPSRLKGDDPKEDVVEDTLNHLWKFKDYPETDAIIVPGDVGNDFLTYTRTITWLSKKYKQVYIVLGNHDVLARGATPSQSNVQFNTSDDKVAALKAHAAQYPNVHLLDGDVHNGIGGTMGMCDLKCEVVPWRNIKFDWKKWFDGKHWKHYISKDPEEIWNAEAEKLNKILEQKPKIVMTHFVPYEAGINWHYRNDPCNVFFYFNAEEFLDKMEDGTLWLCGHVHDKKIINWVNSSGKHITILCNPSGYPGEGSMYADKADVEDGKLNRYSGTTEWSDFIIDIPEE